MKHLFLTYCTLPRIGSGADHITSKCIGLKTALVAPQQPQARFCNRCRTPPSTLGPTGTGSPGDINAWVVHILA